MRRVSMSLLLGLLLCLPFMAITASVVHAEDFLVCWNLIGFPDSMCLWAEGPAPDRTQLYALKAAEFNGPGENGYRLPGHGSATLVYAPTTPAPLVPIVMSIEFDNTAAAPSAFGGNPDCHFRATISRSTLNGSLTARCTGGAGAEWNNTAPLTFVDCDDVVAASGQSSTASTHPRFGD